MPAAMMIQLRKGRDGPATLACVRADGSRTWSKVHPFFPVHDLTHCAVESVLGFREAFFGLVASGWALDDFAPRVPLPREARLAECIVGVFDLERAQPAPYSAAQFNEMVSASLQGQGLGTFRHITDPELTRVRELRSRWSRSWAALELGGTLEIPFPAPPDGGSAAARRSP
jgi:hypothetical protein